jgi:hypothetical protein
MENRKKVHKDKYEKITNEWNYDVSCVCISLPVRDLDPFKP